jgi:outer membrane protein assembly factor BamB
MFTVSGRYRTRQWRVLSLVCLTLLVTLAGFATSVEATPIYIESRGTTLDVIDSNTGASSVIGPYGVAGVLAQAFGPDGVLYAMFNAGSPNAHLATVNTQTGAATPIGAATGVALQAMAFGPDGTLYAGSFTTNNLYKINLSTGAPTLIGSLGFNWIMDLAFDSANQTMYAIAAPPNCTGSSFYSVNLGTGNGSLISNVPADNCLMALAADSSGNLFTTGFMTGTLYQIDPVSGNTTNIGDTGVFSTMGAAAAPVPEPASILLFGSGALGLARIVRRKRAS